MPLLVPRILLISFLLIFQIAAAQEKQTSKGKVLYMQNCARCHGMNGGGGEGPALNKHDLPRAPDDAAFANVISEGIPGTGMYGNWTLGANEISLIIGFVRSLSTIEKEITTGDAQKGLALINKIGCLNCHSVSGKGISLGPDLNSVGLRRSVNYLREALVYPGKQKVFDENGFALFLVVEVTLGNGTLIRGIRTNEDTYTIQIKDETNNFYSFRKSAVRSINRIPNSSLMPTYSKTLTDEEREDIIAFLMNQKTR